MSLKVNGCKPIRVFFFGDSICFGQGVSIHSGWVTKISFHLNELAKKYNREILVVNASVNGNTTRQALERMPYDIQTQNADIIIIQFGMNDCNYWQTDHGIPRVSPKSFEANMEEIILRAHVFGSKKIFLNTNHPTGRSQELMPNAKLTYQQNNQIYNQIIKKIAKKKNPPTILNDVEASFNKYVNNSGSKLAELVLPDLLHLSEQGHQLYFKTIYPPVEKAVKELISNLRQSSGKRR